MRFIERIAVSGAAAVIGGLAYMSLAAADHRPVIAVPGNPQVPVIVEGVDATDAVIVGEWGLYAPGRIAPRIIAPVWAAPPPGHAYYPTTGQRPRYGRQEVEGARVAPTPAPSFHRSWSAGSAAGPVTEYPPFEPPPVVVTPHGRRGVWRDR